MSITIKAELQDEDATARLQAMLERMSNRRTFFERVGNRLVKSASDNFRNQSGPDGKPWTPLRPATVKGRMRAGLTPIAILRARGDLAGSIKYEATEDEVRVGSPVIYAAIHQLGGTIQKAAGSRWMAGRRFAKRDKHPEGADKAVAAHGITIPSRPFIGVSPKDEVAILTDAEDWLTL